MGYVHLSTAERHAIAVLHRLHYGICAIAAQLNRHHATIARELRRGMRNNTYIAADAHRAAIQRQHATPRIGRYTPHLATAISVLLCRTWSPEQIAGYQRTHGITHVSFATIYHWMYAGKLPTVTVAVLRHKGKRRAPEE